MGYPKEIYNKAWDVLDSRRRLAQQNLIDNQNEVRMKLPEIAAIQRQMMATGAEITKAVVKDPENAKKHIDLLAEKNLELQKQREVLLVAAGYPKHYLKERYTCSKCSDTGYNGQEMCDCFKEILKRIAFDQLNYDSDGVEYSFNNFSLDYYSTRPDATGVSPRRRMSEIYEFCKVYARRFDTDSPSLVMMGRTGLGKTHLSLSIAREVTEKGFGVVYTPVQKLMDKLEVDKFSYDPEDKKSYQSNMEAVMQCDLLVLDDLGTEFTTTFTRSVLYNIVNTRLVEGRPTIINTNLEPVELEQAYSQRMASRLGFEYKILRFIGEDIRYIKRQNRYKGR